MILALKAADRTTQAWLLPAAEASAIAAATSAPQLDWESGRQLSDELLGHLISLVESRGYQLSDLTGLVLFRGPGSFTSLRIGHAVMNALGDSLKIPIAGGEGDAWLADGLRALRHTQPGTPVLPLYGSEAHITRPKRVFNKPLP